MEQVEYKACFVKAYNSLTAAGKARASEVYDLNIRGVESYREQGKSLSWIVHQVATYNLELPPCKKRKKRCGA